MPYRRRPNKPCVMCGDLFPPLRSVVTCSDECADARRLQRIAKWWEEHREEQLEKARMWRKQHLEVARAAERVKQRKRRGTDPAKYIENRDPEAIKARARERWRRGQAARRARMREIPATTGE